MDYNLFGIRNLLLNKFTEEDFLNLCFFYFRPVYNNFTDGQERSDRVRALIEYVELRNEIPKLLNAARGINASVNLDPIQRQDDSGTASTKSRNGLCDILVLAANPQGTDLLQLEHEASLINTEIKNGTQQFTIVIERAVRVDELSRYLLQYQPIIIHFSGHGSSHGEIILENEIGQAQPITASSLASLLAVSQNRTECVVLNLCFSLERADALVDQVDCIIGMSGEFDDESAIEFARGFYRGLSFDKGYYTAFELGCEQIKLKKLPDSQVPQFITHQIGLLERNSVKPRVKRTYSSPPEVEQNTANLLPLWFGTNRCPVDANDLSKGFSGNRDNQIHYGICQVAVPKAHEIGSIGSSWLKRLLIGKDSRPHLDQTSVQKVTEILFWAHIKEYLKHYKSDENMALIYIHGFNMSFEAAAIRAAQIGFDLQIPGITAFYSWPSKGKLTGYTADEATIQASERYIAEFLIRFAERSGVKHIHIIAHSMGNRGLLGSMQRILNQAKGDSKVQFGQIILAAPDVDPDVFQDLAHAYIELAQRTTLYVSSKDKALATSGIVHDYPRIGYFPPLTVIPGIDVVEVSRIDLSFLGHGYYADAKELLQDIYTLLTHNASPDKRFGLRASTTNINEEYWSFIK